MILHEILLHFDIEQENIHLEKNNPIQMVNKVKELLLKPNIWMSATVCIWGGTFRAYNCDNALKDAFFICHYQIHVYEPVMKLMCASHLSKFLY